jgi:hypothetical protein
MRARKRLAALLIAGALSAPMLTPAPASAQLPVLGQGGLLGLNLTDLLTTPGAGSLGGLAGVLGGGLLNDVLRDSALLNQCGLALGLLDPATCLTASTLPTTTGLTPFGTLNPFGTLSPITTGFPSFGTGFGGFPHVIPVPVATANQPIVVTNNNASSSSSSAAAAAAPGGGASATATGNSNSNQSQTIVIP